MSDTRRSRLRERLKDPAIAVIPGCVDAVGARLIENEGFAVAYITGAGVAATLGSPDHLGLITMSEVIDRARVIARSIDLPVVCDGDSGYGNAANLYRAVGEFEAAGVAGIHVEDSAFPKKSFATSRSDVISKDEAVNKIRAAVAARKDPEFVIIARCDAAHAEGIPAAIERGKAYVAAGADAVMYHGPKNADELTQVARGTPAPTLTLNSESGNMPMISAADLQSFGFAAVIFPITTLLAAALAMQKGLRVIRERGTTEGWYDNLMPLREVHQNVVRLPQAKELMEKYGLG